MGKHHKNSNNPSNKSNSSNGLGNFGGFNIGDLLKNIDFNQIISLLSSFVGAKNMNTDQLSSMIRNLDLNDVAKESNSSNSSKIDINKLQSQLSLLADRLDEVEGGKSGNVHDELLNAVKNIQDTPGGTDAVLDFLKSSLNSADEDNKNKKKNK